MSLNIAPSIRHALERGEAVVALESTVVTHGLPRPRNLALARRLEAVVVEEGGVPATVGVVDGRLSVGLDDADLERLANQPADKASTWNLAAIIARGGNAGTTVATTVAAAAAAGIPVFATGGIGGVHDHPFDESADLLALASASVVTVCAGPKSILDAAATLERLETLGVPVLGYRSRSLAGFLVRETELALPSHVGSAAEVARVLAVQRQLGLRQGILVSNPVSSGLEATDFEALSKQARRDMDAAGVTGRDSTPFLLARLAELSEGRSVDVNLRLLEENVRLATKIARAITGGAGAEELASEATQPVGSAS